MIFSITIFGLYHILTTSFLLILNFIPLHLFVYFSFMVALILHCLTPFLLHFMCFHEWMELWETGFQITSCLFFLLPHMHFLDTLNEIIFCFSKADWCFKAILFRIARIKKITCTLSHSDEQYFAVSSPPHTVQSSNEEVFAELVFVPQQGALL